MQNIKLCDKFKIKQGAFYFGESNNKYSEGYIELHPYSSLEIHNRTTGIENLTQIKGKCIMIVFNNLQGTNYLLKKGNKLQIKPKGTWHIHSNPFNKTSLTYWYFEGDIRKIIEHIKKGVE
jgi:hypothetical protein